MNLVTFRCKHEHETIVDDQVPVNIIKQGSMPCSHIGCTNTAIRTNITPKEDVVPSHEFIKPNRAERLNIVANIYDPKHKAVVLKRLNVGLWVIRKILITSPNKTTT